MRVVLSIRGGRSPISSAMSARRLPVQRSPPGPAPAPCPSVPPGGDRSEEHTSELQSLMRISYAVFCLKKKNSTLLTSTLNLDQYQDIHTLSNKPDELIY